MKAPKHIPSGDPVDFASSDTATTFWPVITADPKQFEINYQAIDNSLVGSRPGRCFLAERSGGARRHVGLDLFCAHRDIVVACEDGIVVAYYGFYDTSAGELSYALFVQHENFVINYGEVKGDAQQEFSWRIGDKVRAGQHIARVSTTNMLHFETYINGTGRNQRWMTGAARPNRLLNPTGYLIGLATRATGQAGAPLAGVTASPVSAAVTSAPAATHAEAHGSNNSHPKPQIKEFIQSPNHSSRNGSGIDMVVVHCTEIPLKETIKIFQNPGGRQVSAHYVIARDGDIYQMVSDSDRAHHCKGANKNSIGIEHVGGETDSLSDAQTEASAGLVRWLLEQYDIPKSRVFGHDFAPGYDRSKGGTSCPDMLFGGGHSQKAIQDWVGKHV